MAGYSQIPNPLDELHWAKSRIEKIRQYLSENIETNLRLAVVADKFQLSVSSLQHIFKKYQGQSYHQYVEEIRMKKAFDLITKEGKIIKEAMCLTGYKKRMTFNRAFKRIYKHPPGYFMK